MPAVFEEEDILHLGLMCAGHPKQSITRCCQKTNIRRFEARYYACPQTVCAILHDLSVTDIAAAHVAKPNPKHLFMALNWLKEYPIEENHAATFKCTEKTAKK